MQRPDQCSDFLFVCDQHQIIHHFRILFPPPHFGDDQFAFFKEFIEGRFLDAGRNDRDGRKIGRRCMRDDTAGDESVVEKVLQCVFHGYLLAVDFVIKTISCGTFDIILQGVVLYNKLLHKIIMKSNELLV